MDMTGEHQINAPRAAVWAALNDPEILKQSIAGCEEIVQHSPTELTAQVTAKVGPVKAKFNGKITLSDLDPPNGYALTGEGQGGAAGFAKGGAKVHLEDAPGGGTLLKYEMHAQIGGKLAQIGSRLIDGAARKMGDDFFTAFTAAVEAKMASAALPGVEAEPAMAPGAVPVPGGAPVAPPEAAARSSGLPPAVWICGLIVVVGAALWWFLRR